MMELESRIHELLALRSQRRIDRLRRDREPWREDEKGDGGLSSEVAISDHDARLVTTRRGFLDAQLQVETLTPLKRLHIALQLDEIADNVPISPTEETKSALEQEFLAIDRERKCFDTIYTGTPTRTVDLREALFDSSDKLLRANEAVAFSSSRQGFTMRVVVFTITAGGDIFARSSLYVPDLQDEIRRLMGKDSIDIGALFRCLWAHTGEP